MFMLVAQLVLSVLFTPWTSIERGLSGARGGLGSEQSVQRKRILREGRMHKSTATYRDVDLEEAGVLEHLQLA